MPGLGLQIRWHCTSYWEKQKYLRSIIILLSWYLNFTPKDSFSLSNYPSSIHVVEIKAWQKKHVISVSWYISHSLACESRNLVLCLVSNLEWAGWPYAAGPVPEVDGVLVEEGAADPVLLIIAVHSVEGCLWEARWFSDWHTAVWMEANVNMTS